MSKSFGGTQIFTCTCSNEFQDGLYGKGKRVANKRGGKSANASYRCSICGKEHDGK
jgi:hypothetical protein